MELTECKTENKITYTFPEKPCGGYCPGEKQNNNGRRATPLAESFGGVEKLRIMDTIFVFTKGLIDKTQFNAYRQDLQNVKERFSITR
ncbi:hypothetical protein WG66_014394 [Moniliophthora roreri]|nr:hypothetical protein WG66_014394 [Moniliophthora roreri]